ncbi:F-box protein [Trifolium medium]|uniref:F-box protein n=1 Tax=Trifolium medium TaxID=97028 RepID=A0A392M0A3_9FABA|nr:F-box protein [Trifolium medium]
MAPKRKEVSSIYISDDISFSILSKLSVRSLYRFSCVCKSWNHIFQNPNFINMFRKNLISKSCSLSDENDVRLILHQGVPFFPLNWYLFSGDRFENKLKLNFPSPSPFNIGWGNGVALIGVLGSAVNGMLCVYNCNNRNDDINCVLWNLPTEEIKLVPHSNSHMEFTAYSILHGFGYDLVRDDYKVIQCVDYIFADDLHPFWEVYSLKSNSWRKLGFHMPICNESRYRSTNRDVYMNGMCHWLGETIDETCVVVSFNLSNDVFFITPLPPDCFDVNLGVLYGSFTMISNYKKTGSFHVSILGEFGVKESWVKIFDIGPLSCIEHPIGSGKDNVFFRKKDDELVSFNLTTGMIEEIGVKGEKCWCQMITYEKNLHPIEGMNN